MNVYYNSEGFILIEFAGNALELDRKEAEQLFVDLGYTLQDMDVATFEENGEDSPQP